MNNKQHFIIFSLLLLTTTMVSADWTTDIKDAGNDVYNVLEPVLKFITGPESTGTEFVAKILFFILIFSLIWVSLQNVQIIRDTEWVHWTSSIVVGILAVRFLGDSSIISAILLPYSALGVALISLIPFIAYFFVVKDLKKSARKMAWILFTVVFIALWISRSGETKTGLEVGKFAWIYLLTAVLSLGMLFADGTIQRMMMKSRYEDYKELEESGVRAKLVENRATLENRRSMGLPEPDYRKLDEALRKEEKRAGII